MEDVILRLQRLGTMPEGAFIYHTGFLAFDRRPIGGVLPPIDRVAKIAWDLCEKGRIKLFQRKLGVCRYEYIATRREENV